MMSRCFTWVPIIGLGEPNIYHKLVDFSIMGDLNRKVVIK